MEPEMDSVAAKAAATLSRDIFLRPLRALCVRKIAFSLKFYVDNGVTSLHSYLLPKLCGEVFESYLKLLSHEERKISFEHQQWKQDAGFILYKRLPNSELLKMASLFIGPGLKHFAVSELYSPDVNDGFEDLKLFFNKLLDGAPKLESFDFQLNEAYGKSFASLQQPPSYFIGFEKMACLRTLKVGPKLVFSNADLQIVSTSLPLLRILDIALDFSVTNEEGLVHLQQLKMLEHLIFFFVRPDKGEFWTTAYETNRKRIEFCLLILPKLKICGYEVFDYINHALDSHSFSIFKKTENPVELGLEHLSLWNDFPPANVLLPHVTRLEVLGTEALNFVLKRSLPKLKVLLVSHVSFSDFVKLLNHLGQLLVKLDTEAIEGGSDNLLVILRCCPQLERLEYYHPACMKDVACNLMASRLSLVKIKYFDLTAICEGPGDHSNCKATGLLRLLLTSCPELEELRLETSIPQAEVDEIAAWMEAGSICLPKLKNVSISNNPAIEKKSKLNFVQQVIAHCPQLENIFVNGDSCNSELGPFKATLDKFGRGHVLRSL